MLLSADQLVLDRGGRIIIDRLSLAVASGEALVLSGPNGAGKTTLLRALAGFLRPLSGAVKLDGGDAEKTIGEQAHIVGHSNAIKGQLTVRENVAFWAGYLAQTPASRNRVSMALKHFGLADIDDYPAAYLSAGQKRRLGLTRLLSADRPLWLLDEPTVSLDTASVALLADAINAHTQVGGIVIAATHLPLGLKRARDLILAPYAATQHGAEGYLL